MGRPVPNQTLKGPWNGWRLRNQHLIGPNDENFTPADLAAYWVRWQQFIELRKLLREPHQFEITVPKH